MSKYEFEVTAYWGLLISEEYFGNLSHACLAKWGFVVIGDPKPQLLASQEEHSRCEVGSCEIYGLPAQTKIIKKYTFWNSKVGFEQHRIWKIRSKKASGKEELRRYEIQKHWNVPNAWHHHVAFQNTSKFKWRTS